jgi:hypothetical protein
MTSFIYLVMFYMLFFVGLNHRQVVIFLTSNCSGHDQFCWRRVHRSQAACSRWLCRAWAWPAARAVAPRRALAIAPGLPPIPSP